MRIRLFSAPPARTSVTGPGSACAAVAVSAAIAINAVRSAFFIDPSAQRVWSGPFHRNNRFRQTLRPLGNLRPRKTTAYGAALEIDRAADRETLEVEDLLDRLGADRRVGGQRHHRQL